MTRTDVHAPSSVDFDPELYVCYGVQDNDELNIQDREILNSLLERGYKRASSSRQCGHCGSRMRYAALMVREDVREFIYVGETCLGNRFELTKTAFQQLRAEAKLNRDRATVKELREALIAQYPDLIARMAEIAKKQDVTHTEFFIADVYERFQRTGKLTEKQIAAVEKALVRYDERMVRLAQRDADKAKLLAAGVRVPEGKVTVVGEIVSIKWKDSDFGGSYKMTVRSDEGWAVWLTLPSALEYADAVAGDRVSFNCTITASDDVTFGFGKRPTKAVILVKFGA